MSEIDVKQQLAPFRFREAERLELEKRFRLCIAGCDLSKSLDQRRKLTEHAGAPGIYFWVLGAWNAKFKLYIGQTKSLSYRLSNYTSPFQPNATNDFKMRIAHAFFAERIPDAQFDLHFRPIEPGTTDLRLALRSAEAEALKGFAPVLLNQRGVVAPEAKMALERAYVAFYRANLESVLAAKRDTHDA